MSPRSPVMPVLASAASVRRRDALAPPHLRRRMASARCRPAPASTTRARGAPRTPGPPPCRPRRRQGLTGVVTAAAAPVPLPPRRREARRRAPGPARHADGAISRGCRSRGPCCTRAIWSGSCCSRRG
ncbi:hypothetical protein GQ55_4G299300 [Panicum hallii var. hallii]|uniref:Uncharacterized protein n=1 Tax=Panicum hallii var. hallii TaxID=1504633 RepID=A0A2T7E1K2_9POAL|nr:hypothetical protein GQ55_4G299300 [Panicum hallii var. hallii]